MQKEITEIFDEYESTFDKRQLRRLESGDESLCFQNLLAYQAGVTQIVSPAWVLFRAYASRPDRYSAFVSGCNLIVSGRHSLREVSRITGWHYSTVLKYTKALLALRMRLGLGDILCPCGKPIMEHRGSCEFRHNHKHPINNFYIRRKNHTSAWHVLRVRAKKGDRRKLFIAMARKIMTGRYSLRQISRESGWSMVTVVKLMKQITKLRTTAGLPEITCPCGKPIATHHGWCRFRYEQSPVRQAFVKKQRGKFSKEYKLRLVVNA